MQIHRTRIGKEIIAEFTIPEKQTGKVAIIAAGMPSGSPKPDLLRFLAKQGYVAIHPRYRGTWESEGEFLKEEPTADIKETIDVLKSQGILYSLWEEKEYSLPKKLSFFVFAHSFGGPAGILLSKRTDIKAIVCVAPVVDWAMESESEPLDWLYTLIKKAYGNAYQLKKSNWDKLKNTQFYNPAKQTGKVSGSKILIFHAKDDTAIPYKSVVDFAKEHQIKLHLREGGGHISLADVPSSFYWKRIKTFLS